MHPFRCLPGLLALLVGAATLRAEPPDPGKSPYAARRVRLQAQLGEGLALVHSGPAAEPFRPDNDFLYLTGLEWPDAVLAMTRDGSWIFEGDGTRKAPEGFKEVTPADQLDLAAGRYFTEGLWIPGGRYEFYSIFNVPGEKREFGDPFEHAERREKWGQDLKSRVEYPNVRALEHRLARMRLVKDESELALLRKALKITGDSLVAAISKAKPGMKEREFQRVLEQGYLDGGAEWLAFPTIVGSGMNGTMVHYTENGEQLDRNELVVVDTGAEFGGYAADITRTFPADGKFSKRQRVVYEAVLAAQKAGIAAIKPGTTLLQIDAVARRTLDDLGFEGKMPHLTGHWVGLQVHDVGSYATRLEPGMVVTVEPGVYLGDEGIGVRIEDVFVVTKDGAENLSAWIPKSIDEIEKLVGSAAK
ncbi:MAG: Xaa-Pro [Planctomycetota bacterium]|nr:MAG: Xaa-Pro [Planctomycetota bacterium]